MSQMRAKYAGKCVRCDEVFSAGMWIEYDRDHKTTTCLMHPNWARSLRDQCQAAGVPFFFKQWGEWLPSYDADQRKICAPEKSYLPLTPDGDPMAFPCMMTRVGKKLAGSLLDGQAWKEFPR